MVNITLGPPNLTDVQTDRSTEREERLTDSEIFMICIYFVILIMGVIGNGLVIFVTGYKMKKTVNSIWFLNLAIADFIFISFLVLHIAVAFDRMVWPFGNFMCKFMSFVTVQNMFASIFLLTVVSLDRCLCTWLLAWVKIIRTLVKARIMCVCVWFLSICCTVPYAINRSVQEYNGSKYCVYTISSDVMKFLIPFRFMVGFLIPFLIIACSYVAIAVRVKQLQTGKQLRSFRVLSVILAFFICWFPFHVQQICHLSISENKWNDRIQDLVYAVGPYVNCLAYLNSCLNPILYVFMCEEYKKKLSKSLLLVFKEAFAEDNLGFRSTCHSTGTRLLQSRSIRKTNDTASSSSASSQENRKSFQL